MARPGATEDEINMTAFDWDYVPVARCGVNCGIRGGAKPVVIEDTPTRRIERDALGRTLELDKRTATIPLPRDYPVTDMDSWLAVKPLYTWHEDRVDVDALTAAAAAQQRGELVVSGILGGFDTARSLMGEEVACMAYYDQPELMHDILDTLTDTAVRAYERVVEHLTIDQLSVHEDFAGRSGPLVGPAQMRDFIGPYYRKVWDVVASAGTRLFEIDSDGNLDPVIGALIDAGLTGMHPVEPMAGMDPVTVRATWGRRLTMKGGIDKFVIAKGRDAIRAELEYKFDASLRAGGMVFGLDHRIPSGTPLDDYRYYVSLGREMLGLEPLDASRTGWGRMAF